MPTQSPAMLAMNESHSPALPEEIIVPIFQPTYPTALLTALMLNHLMARFLRRPGPGPDSGYRLFRDSHKVWPLICSR